MQLGLVFIDNVHNLDTVCFRVIGNQRAMATPPNRFRAHNRGRTEFVRKIEKAFDASAKFFGFHVIGITAKRSVAPGRVVRILLCFSSTAQFGEVLVANSVFCE